MSSTRPLHILQVSTSLPEGGLSRVVLDLSAELKRRGHRVSLCTTHMPGVHFAGTEHLWHQVYQFAAPSQLNKLMRLKKVMADGEFDVVQTWQEPIALIAAAWLSKAAAVDTPVLLEHWTGLGPFPLPLLRRLCTTKFVACSKEMQEEMLAGHMVPADRLTFIDNAQEVSEPGTSEDVRRFRESLSLPESARIVGTVARFCYQKGVRYLVEAMPEILRQHPETHLVLPGDGELRGELVELTKKLQIEPRVHFLGYRNDIPKLVTAYDVFVLPSLFEGLSMAILEAMTQARPMVLTALPVNQRVAGGVAELVPTENPGAIAAAVNRLLGDPEHAARLGAAARQRAQEQFTVEHMADRYLEVYAEAMRARGRKL